MDEFVDVFAYSFRALPWLRLTTWTRSLQATPSRSNCVCLSLCFSLCVCVSLSFSLSLPLPVKLSLRLSRSLLLLHQFDRLTVESIYIVLIVCVLLKRNLYVTWSFPSASYRIPLSVRLPCSVPVCVSVVLWITISLGIYLQLLFSSNCSCFPPEAINFSG